MMEVAKSEPIWVTNIKKGVVQTMRSAPILSNMGLSQPNPILDYINPSNNHVESFFSLEEATLLGKCNSE